jgi:hypothetical protein
MINPSKLQDQVKAMVFVFTIPALNGGNFSDTKTTYSSMPGTKRSLQSVKARMKKETLLELLKTILRNLINFGQFFILPIRNQ